MQGEVHIFEQPAQLHHAAAERLLDLGREAIKQRGAFHLVLSGGSTPAGLYQLIGEQHRQDLDWSRVHIYFGDERCVPADHEMSNYRMARELMLSRLPIPSVQVHAISGDLPPALAVGEYRDLLEHQPPRDDGPLPRFDLILLGMGDDGHIASLFPGSELLYRRKVLVDEVHLDHLDARQPGSRRITLTLPVLNHARHLMLLVSGASKAAMLERITREEGEDKAPHAPLPIQMLQPLGGMEWYLDRDAAAGLNSPHERDPLSH